MGYHVIDPTDLDRTANRPSDMRDVSEAAAMETMGLRVYYVDPGEDIPVSGMHYHDEQEEVFYVVDGALIVETPDGTIDVPEGQFFIAGPESPHRAHNPIDADGPIEVIAIGAPAVNDGHLYEG